MVRSMKCVGAGLLCLVVVGFARPAAAQDTPKVELSGGYNWLTVRPSGDEEWTKFPKGWYVDVAGNATKMMSVVGQVTGNYKTYEDVNFDLKIHTFMGGVRWGAPGRVKGFGQFLAGAAAIGGSGVGFDETEKDFAIQLGGGVNVLGGGVVGIRAGADYLRIFAKDDGVVVSGGDVNGFRLNVGVVIGIGNR